MMMMMMMKVDDGFRLQNVYAPGVSLHPSMSCHVTRSSNHQRGFTHAESDSNPVLGVCCCSSRCQSGDTASKVWRNETPQEWISSQNEQCGRWLGGEGDRRKLHFQMFGGGHLDERFMPHATEVPLQNKIKN